MKLMAPNTPVRVDAQPTHVWCLCAIVWAVRAGKDGSGGSDRILRSEDGTLPRETTKNIRQQAELLTQDTSGNRVKGVGSRGSKGQRRPCPDVRCWRCSDSFQLVGCFRDSGRKLVI